MACDQVVLRFHWKELPVGEEPTPPLTLQFSCFITFSAELKRREPWRQPFPFFDKSDFAGVPSQRSKRPIKEFEAAIDRAVGDLVRADGACGVDLWSALANVRWHASNGAVVSYSFREAATLVAWVREEGDYILWYCSGPPGVVAPWIGEAMAVEGWSWTASD
jgi:hypothetical protein